MMRLGGCQAWEMAESLLAKHPDGPLFPWVASQVARANGRLDESCSLMDKAQSNAAEASHMPANMPACPASICP